eukprot:TRINITY_DN14868_c0_g1_i1.p1 TRINITY_DN14868_c0_g1~~TRINITY_DN14868_c0_g1_i1.p1  ORF type:complete len:553 (+),score=87.03 TRINITY_DN14868_c0_g1_i1:97-1755(+)
MKCREAVLWALCCAGCMALVAARQIDFASGQMDGESPLASTLRLGTTAAAMFLMAQLLFSDTAGKGSIELKKNTDKSLTFREEEGVAKLVPVVPEPSAKAKAPLARYTMAEVAKHNSRESIWIIVDERVYDLTKYIDKHPGGPLMIENMAGKDCTDVFANYHSARIYKHMLPPMLIGEATDVKVPAHVQDFREVRQELLRRGLFETDMRFYGKMAAWLVSLFLLALYLSLGCTSCGAHMTGAAIMGLFWQQLAGIGHDMGHSGVSHNFHLDHSICSCLVSVMGISVCWWKRNHNTHHIVCNSIEHDPDIQHMPLMAVTPEIFKKPYWSTYYKEMKAMDAIARFLVSYEHILFYPVMMLARFNLYAQSLIQLCAKEPLHYRKLELCAFGVYFMWISKLVLSLPTWSESLGWLLVSHAMAGLLHVQICCSHFSMETYHGHAYNDASDEWYITQLKTTMNFDTPPMLDWVHIGLQFQIEHHLFPRLPRHNLREARKLVKEVCKKHKIRYHEPGFLQANLETLGCLWRSAQAARAAKRGSSGFYESLLWDGINLNG